MTIQEIKNYFGITPVYQFNGSMDELHEMQVLNNSSYNTLVVSDVIYFISVNPVTDSRAIDITGVE